MRGGTAAVFFRADTGGEEAITVGPRSDKNTPSARRGGNHTTMMSDSSASLWQLGPGTRGLATASTTASIQTHKHHTTKSAAVTHKSNAPAFTQQEQSLSLV